MNLEQIQNLNESATKDVPPRCRIQPGGEGQTGACILLSQQMPEYKRVRNSVGGELRVM